MEEFGATQPSWFVMGVIRGSRIVAGIEFVIFSTLIISPALQFTVRSCSVSLSRILTVTFGGLGISGFTVKNDPQLVQMREGSVTNKVMSWVKVLGISGA